ncbi:MAG TPA: hypothetical protein VJX68_03515 [Candidatus Binatus sp.]|uniref:hypothetical protein n=1 Tax=Candidatus Binatus sp. TaxID=2811406 RepID=UPI002B46ED98|nr:hypothetical protein [Candidatus Binatus sp.]HKN12242.1 hypothetical protein [Candidatus Binatus sp.]
MLIADGEFRYDIRKAGELIAVETETLAWGMIRGVRRPASGSNVYEVEAELDDAGLVRRVVVSYSRGPFSRNATYVAADNFLRGNISAGGSRNDLTTKLGRYSEVDADLVIFRALIIAHIRDRKQTRWTGRVAAIDANTLVAATGKQSCRQRSSDPHVWIYEPRMGDAEEIEIDDSGHVVRRRDSRGVETILVSKTPVSE